MSVKKSMKFEDAIKRLEEIVEKIGNRDIPLEESMKLFEEGMELSAMCNGKLDEAERKINILVKGKDGSMVESSFSPEEE